MKSNQLVILILYIIFSNKLCANVLDTSYKNSDDIDEGFFISFLTHLPFIDNKQFNERLAINNEPKMRINSIFWGLSMSNYFDRVIIDYGVSYSIHNFSQFNYNVRDRLSSFYMSLGVDLIENEKFSMYPSLGWRYSSISHSFSELMDISSINDFTDNDFENKNYHQHRNFLDLSFTISRQKILRVNFTAGYLFPILPEKWSLNDQNSVPLSTNYFKQNFYFSLGIGLGSFKKEKNFPYLEEIFEYEEVPDWNPEL